MALTKLKSGNLLDIEKVSAVSKVGPNFVAHMDSGKDLVIEQSDLDLLDENPDLPPVTPPATSERH